MQYIVTKLLYVYRHKFFLYFIPLNLMLNEVIYNINLINEIKNLFKQFIQQNNFSKKNCQIVM